MSGRITRFVLVVLAVGALGGLWVLVDAAAEVWRAVRAGPPPAAAPADPVAERPESRDRPGVAARITDPAGRASLRAPLDPRERRRDARREWRASLEPEERAQLREERRERREAMTPEERDAQQQRKQSVRLLLEDVIGARASVPGLAVEAAGPAPAGAPEAEPPVDPAEQVTDDPDVR